MLPFVNQSLSTFNWPSGSTFVLPTQGLASAYAAALMGSLNATVRRHGDAATLSPQQAWRDSGLGEISGLADGPALDCPAPLASCADGVMLAINAMLDTPLPWCGRRLLGMRRLTHALQRRGRVSANASCRLLSTANGDIAVNLARDDDWQLLPAWLECEAVNSWEDLAALIARHERDELLARARLLGLAVAPDMPNQPCAWFHAEHLNARSGTPSARLKVVDLSALWAGPLCSFVLASAGADVVRIEHPQRPDGARLGPPGFFAALDRGKRTQTLDLRTSAGRSELLGLIAQADVVIEGSRPRALRQLGIDAAALVQSQPGLCWLSITGYGRAEPQANWVAFGDDAAVAAGLSDLMWRHHGQRVFCGDAIADPLTGLHAALLVLATRRAGQGGLFSLALRDVSAHAISVGMNLL